MVDKVAVGVGVAFAAVAILGIARARAAAVTVSAATPTAYVLPPPLFPQDGAAAVPGFDTQSQAQNAIAQILNTLLRGAPRPNLVAQPGSDGKWYIVSLDFPPR